MTYSSQLATNLGTIEVFVRIDGIKYVLGTSEDAPSDSWYSSGGFSYLQGLVAKSISLHARIRPGEVWPEVQTFDVRFQDKDGTFSQYMKSIEGLNSTKLTVTLEEGDTSAEVAATADFASSGDAYVDKETIAYSSKDADSFLTLTRGKYGSVDVDHYVDLNLTPTCEPEVADGPGDLEGRRVIIYMATRENGTLTATEQVWLGVVTGPLTWQPPCIATFPVTHSVEVFRQGMLFSWVPSARMRGLYVVNDEGWRAGRVMIVTKTGGAVTNTPVDVVTDGTGQHFETPVELFEALQDAINAVSSDWSIWDPAGQHVHVQYNGSADEAALTDAVNPEGGILWLLGFTGETDGVRGTGLLTSGGAWSVAPDPLTVAYVRTKPSGLGYEPRIYLHEGEAQWFRTTYVVADSVENSGYMRVVEVDETYDFLHVRGGTLGETGDEWPEHLMTRSGYDGDTPTIRQVWYLRDIELYTAIRMIYSGELDGDFAFEYTPPVDWRVSVALHDDDVDWSELEQVLDYAPPALRSIRKAMEEPTQVSDFLTGILLACGVYVSINNDGTIGFRKVQVPSYGDMEVTVDASYIDSRRAKEIETRSRDDRVLNVINFDIEDPEGSSLFLKAKKVMVVDRQSVQRYGPRMARDVTDPVAAMTKLAVSFKLCIETRNIPTLHQTQEAIGAHVLNNVMGLLGKPRATSRLPTGPKARLLELGDGVFVTSPFIRNPLTGVWGIEDFEAMVVGFDREAGPQTPDYLELMLLGEVGGMIAPAALATSWDGGTYTLTFAATNLFKRSDDATDLDYFEEDDYIQGLDYDSVSPSTWTAQVDSVNPGAGTMVLKNITGSVAVPAIVRFDAYGTASADQKAERWAWIGDADDGLIVDTDPAPKVGL